jgi:hypothetical protein
MKSFQNKGSDRNRVAPVSSLVDFDEQQLELFESLKQLRLGVRLGTCFLFCSYR